MPISNSCLEKEGGNKVDRVRSRRPILKLLPAPDYFHFHRSFLMKISAYFLISNFLAPHSFKIQLQPRDIQAN